MTDKGTSFPGRKLVIKKKKKVYRVLCVCVYSYRLNFSGQTYLMDRIPLKMLHGVCHICGGWNYFKAFYLHYLRFGTVMKLWLALLASWEKEEQKLWHLHLLWKFKHSAFFIKNKKFDLQRKKLIAESFVVSIGCTSEGIIERNAWDV